MIEDINVFLDSFEEHLHRKTREKEAKITHCKMMYSVRQRKRLQWVVTDRNLWL